MSVCARKSAPDCLYIVLRPIDTSASLIMNLSVYWPITLTTVPCFPAYRNCLIALTNITF